MTAAAINHQPMHRGEELGIWEVPNNVPESYSKIETDSATENSISSADSTNKSLIIKDCSENIVNSNRSQSLTYSSYSPIPDDLTLKRSKSDSSIEICYKDSLNIDDRYKELRDSDRDAPEEPEEPNTFDLSSLKKEIENNIRVNELNLEGILPELKTMLEHGTWKVKMDATLLIVDLLPYIGITEDEFFYELMPLVIQNLSHSEQLVAQCSANLLKTYAESTKDKDTFVEKYISLGILNEDYNIKMSAIASIQRIFNEHLSHLNFFHLVQLMVNFLKGEEDLSSRECFIKALKHIRYIEGPKEFTKYQSLLSPNNGRVLEGAVSDQENRGESEDEVLYIESRKPKEKKRKRKTIIQINYENGAKLLEIIPGEVLEKLMKNDHYSKRIGCEELLAFIEWTPDLRELLINLDTLLSLLNSFKEDSNFGVATISLRIIAVLLTRLTVEEINSNLRPIIHSSTLLFCDERFVVRSEANKTLNGIWQKASPRKVSVLLSEMFNHKSSRVRESSINLITAALLTFPRNSFDFAIISRDVIPKLADSRRRVRQAAMECIATLAQVLGSQNTKVLMSEIMDLEETDEGSGVTCAVKARLSRRKLPHLTSDGLLEYWLPVFNIAKKNYSGMLLGADVEWIMEGTGSLSLGSVCESSLNCLNSSLHSLDFGLQEFGSRDLNSSFHQSLLQSTLRRENAQTGIYRKRSLSAVTLNKFEPIVGPNFCADQIQRSSSEVIFGQSRTWEDRNPLALWSTEPIDLSRTTPQDFGYRGVYLGKIRKGSALGRAINGDKSFAILPNKFATGGIGSARASERGGLSSPQINSPGHHRKLHSLEPLEQVDSSCVLGHQTLSKIPPLRSARPASTESIISDRGEETFKEEEEEEEENNEKEEVEDETENERTADECEEEREEIYNENENQEKSEDENTKNEDLENEFETKDILVTKSENEEISHTHENENETSEKHIEREEFEYEDGISSKEDTDTSRKDEKRGSMETRDSGISLQSPNPEAVNDNFRISSASSEKKNNGSQSVTEDQVEEFFYNDTEESATDGEEEEEERRVEEVSTAELRRRMRRKKSSAYQWRNSDDPQLGRLQVQGEKSRKGSTNSLPTSFDLRSGRFMNKSKGFYPGGPKYKRSNNRSSAEDELSFRNLDYESDFESDEEEKKGLPKDAMGRMHYLKKKRDSMRELEKRISEREAKRDKDRRIMKYKELKERNSGNSLQITRPYEEDPIQNVRYARSPRHSPRHSPSRYRKPFTLPIPKSRSHEFNLDQKSGREPRPSSLDRLEGGGYSKLPFSRAPNQHKKVVRSKGRVAVPIAPEIPTSRRSTPGIGLGSLARGTDVNEDEIPTAAFKKPRVLNTIDGKNIRPLPKPNEAFADNIELLQSEEWEEQVEGIETLVRFATYHPKLIQSNMKEMNGYLMKHAKNLRSQVCRAALQAITHFYVCLKKSMESDLDKMVALLLNKTADTNKFLREDSNFALDAMAEVTTPSKAVSSLVLEGSGHRNPQVRATLGRLLAYIVELIGASKALNQRDVADKLLPAAAKLAQEGSLESRQMAKLIFQRLATQPQFESTFKKYVSSEDVRQMQKFLDNLYNNNNKRGMDASRTKASKGGGRFGRRN